MSIASDLALLGWRTDTPARLSQAVRDFQTGWNLGAALAVDGRAGPATRSAIALSVQRRRDGLPDYSEHFNAREFRCQCDLQRGGPWPDCRRIWITRATVRVAEQWRAIVGPYSPDRGCRCPTENRRVNGVTNSQHLHGRALDVPVYLATVDQARALRSISGIGYYRVTLLGGSTARVVRHIDTRTNATAAAPALWEYGTYRGTPATPRPPGPTPTVPTKPPPTPAQEEDELMALKVKNPHTGEEWSASAALWSIWHYVLETRDVAAQARELAAAAAKASGLTEEQVAAAAAKGAREALSSLEVRVREEPDTQGE